ncbi:MAG TPA: ATP-binding protein [Myxococcaceae bacterium]|nr:ATP-binding protein [Myxococcaceae bacterium]
MSRPSALQRRPALADLLDLPSFQEWVRGFVELYQIGVKVFDGGGGRLADVKIGNGDFCGYVFSFDEGRRRCTATVGRVKDGPLESTQNERHPPGGVVAIPCFTGLRYLAMPILWEGDSLGRVVFGPFTPDDWDWPDFPPSLTEISPTFDARKAREYLAKVRRAPEPTVVKVMAHFGQLLRALIASGFKAYYTSQIHIEATLETNRDLERQNQRLSEANARLRELDRLKSNFLATVSHELRTPLTSILGYSEMLVEGLAGRLTPEQTEYVRTIGEKGETLLGLITSVLDLSQIEAGRVRLIFELHDIASLVSACVSSVRPQSEKKKVSLALHASAVQRTLARADREKLKQLVVNLLANAVKFTQSGGTVSVTVSELATQPELGALGYRIQVEDTGIGIPDGQREQIFRSFYQVDAGPTREHGGIGIGLAIAKGYAEGHGGRVLVSSEVGRGSCFTVVLPAEPATAGAGHIAPPVREPVPDRF